MPEFTQNAQQVLRDGRHFADCHSADDAAEIVRALQVAERMHSADSLLIEAMKAGEMLHAALCEAGETYGYMHAVQFGIEQHLRANGWQKDEPAPDAIDDHERAF